MITVSKSLLIPVLERCSRIAQNKSPHPYLSQIKLEFDDVLTYAVTNLVTSIRGAIDASGDPVKFTTNAHGLLTAAQSVIGDNVKLSLSAKGKLTVSGEGKRLFTCQTLPVEDFPAIDLADGDWVELPTATLQALVSRVMFAIGERDDQESLKCVRIRALDGILSAATANGRALGFASDAIESQATVTAIVPRIGISSLMQIETEKVALLVTPQAVAFRSGPEVLTVRTTVDNFPPVDGMLENTRSSWNKKSLVLAPKMLESLAVIKRTDAKADIDLTFTPGEVKIENGPELDAGYAMDIVEGVGEDSGFVRLAIEYLTGALKGCQNATLYFGEGLDPFSVTDGMFTAIIMPLRKD